MVTQNTTPIIGRVFVDEVLECAHRAGIDVSKLLADLNLTYPELDELTPARFAEVWLEVSRKIGDEFFGLADRPMAPGSFTLMGHAVRSAKTFEIALRRALRFLKVVLGEPYGELTVENGLCTVSLVEADKPRSALA